MRRFFLVACLVLLAMPLLADEIGIQTATTVGCFYTGPTACTPSSGSDTYAGLTFTGAALPLTLTSGGSLEFLLGSFTFSGDPYNFGATDVNFRAIIQFTDPQIIASGNPADYSAIVTGQVNSQGNGTLTVNFDNSLATLAFSNLDYSGSFQFSVNDAKLNVNNPVAPNDGEWNGQVSNAFQSASNPNVDPPAIPEPASLILVGTGFLAIAKLLRGTSVKK